MKQRSKSIFPSILKLDSFFSSTTTLEYLTRTLLLWFYWVWLRYFWFWATQVTELKRLLAKYDIGWIFIIIIIITMIHNRGEGVFSPDSSPYNPRHQYTARNAILPYQIYNNTMNTTIFLLCLRTKSWLIWWPWLWWDGGKRKTYGPIWRRKNIRTNMRKKKY